MGRISHLIPPEKGEQPAYQLEGVIDSIAQIMAQSVSHSAAPEFKRLLQAVVEQGARGDNAVNRATATLNKAIRDEVKSLRPEIKKVLEALQSSSTDMVDLQGRLVTALSNVKIPDYTQQLEDLKAAQPDLSPVLDAIRALESDDDDEEERPREWVFDIERHNNGLLKRVTAKAKA